MSSIDEIKARLDIVEIVSENVQLRRSGKSYSGFCPFHDNTRTPAFVVFPDTGTWRCFGQCSEGGDIFKYVMKRDGGDFAETLKILADRAGVELKPETPKDKARKEEFEYLRTLLEEAVAYYRHHLKTDNGKVALDYLHKRELTDETIATFELGYAPAGYDNIRKHFLEKGYKEKDLVDAGLVSQRDDGGIYDRFRNRVIFPIRDQRGKMAGFGARALSDEDMPKYLNSPQTVLFDKSNLLYGLDKTRKAIRSQDQVVIVEGYLDVIAPFQAGYQNLVSPMGTALTEHQLRMLKRLSRRIVMALDADAAGAKATLRGLQVARKTLDRETDLQFNARGLLQQEGRLKADIRVTTLPDGMDPDNVVNENPEAWVELINAAKPIVIHVLETLSAGKDLGDPKIKTDIASQVMPLINDIPSAIERDTFIQQLARKLKVDEGALLAEYAPHTNSRRPKRRRRKVVQPEQNDLGEEDINVEELANHPLVRLEKYALGIIIRQPELLYRIDRALLNAGLPHTSENDFQITSHQEIFKITKEAIDQDYIEPLNFAVEYLPMPLVEQADTVLSETDDVNLNDERVLTELLRALLRIRETNLRQSINQIRFLMEDSQESGKLRNANYEETILENNQVLLKINKALNNNMSFSTTNGNNR
ncbi:MAG: DNA primase [Chloroflexi bacterium]|jgi:DNA primase|nr:DNA primase [Chloroflexota bacterium]MBT3669196.1 DNA primase [Chloroflexota bacterium]MBT4002732.1 DNA primase [Chloroflexota bacterium]MBT4306441.1 DNA primase [Chloroflexota bacterium]MBT4534940.1 DNA primase [Chloroflexota bacterium]